MMTNLFSIFDPSSSLMSLKLNWVSMVAGFLILPLSSKMGPSRASLSVNSLVSGVGGEMKALLSGQKHMFVLMLLSLFVFILLSNSLGLLPCVFTSSSHLVFTLSLALPLWLGSYLYGWVVYTNNTLAHLVPQGTPGILMPFMVIIEGISGVIRPGTLAVRLAANMIAGHLLLALLAGSISALSLYSVILISAAQVPLLVLEGAVAVIQSYVFAILMTLYISEV